MFHLNDDLFIISAGAQPHPGYPIEIVKTESSVDQLMVYTHMMKPNPLFFAYPMVIDYPYVIGKSKLASNQSLTFVDSKTGKIIPVEWDLEGGRYPLPRETMGGARGQVPCPSFRKNTCGGKLHKVNSSRVGTMYLCPRLQKI